MENEELVEQIQAGIKPTENMEQLYLQNRSFIYQQAKKYAAYADMDDLMQEAYFGLHEAVKHYKPDKETKFLTYLPFRLQKAFRRYIRFIWFNEFQSIRSTLLNSKKPALNRLILKYAGIWNCLNNSLKIYERQCVKRNVSAQAILYPVQII